MRPSPHQIVTKEHGSKADLINKVVGLVEPMDGESADDHKRRLRNVSNAKLLHLLSVGEKAKELGGRDAIVTKILEAKGQTKDHEYKDALGAKPLGQLIDLLHSVQHRAAGKAKKPPKKQRKPKN
jgi:hypothetical protein